MPVSPRIAIYALTHQGIALGETLSTQLGGTLFVAQRLDAIDATPFDSLPRLVADTFSEYDGHIFVAAAGIAVRCIAPHLKSKDVDPAVVVIDQKGEYAVSLLSGHLGGANDLAVQCAGIIGGEAVVTTATDSAGVPSLDVLAQENELAIGNLERVKIVNSALLDKESVQLYDTDNLLGLAGDARFIAISNASQWQSGAPGVWVSFREDCPDGGALRLYPQCLAIGIGCRRDVPETEISAHILNVFDAARLSLKSVASFGSVDLKADEVGLLEAAAKLDIKPKFYTKEQLDGVEAPNPSGTVMRKLGVASVCEAAAMLLSGSRELLVEKTKTKTVTLAVARRKEC